MTIIHPTVHLNGTSRKELLEGYLDARLALIEAREKVGAAGPHPRDYYVQGNEAFTQARAQHVARLTAIDTVLAEIGEIALKLSV